MKVDTDKTTSAPSSASGSDGPGGPEARADREQRTRRILLVAGVGVVVAGAAFAAKPDFVLATLTNPQALLRVGGLGLAVLAVVLLVHRTVPDRRLRAALMALPIAAAAWYTISPALINERVEEALPTTAAAVTALDEETATSEPTNRAQAPSEAAVAPAIVPEPTAAEPTPAEPVVASEPRVSAPVASEPVAEPPAPAEPVRLTSGSFRGLDGHDASGRAALYRLTDGSHIIRLEDVDLDNGPALEVHLVPGADRTRPGSGTKVADLKANRGSANYVLPADLVIDPSQPWTVLVWCRPFSVAIGGASQTAA